MFCILVTTQANQSNICIILQAEILPEEMILLVCYALQIADPFCVSPYPCPLTSTNHIHRPQVNAFMVQRFT